MKQRSLWAPFTALMVAGLAVPAQSQQSTKTTITFASQLEEQGRAQLRRLLESYDLGPWIFTDKVKVEAGVEPHSMPILTINTDHLGDDLRQLSIFIHEQAHWHFARAEGRDGALSDLRALFPDAPADSDRLYQHLLVAWMELDALVELLGEEEEARRILREKVAALTSTLDGAATSRYRWYNQLVLDRTAAIGAVVARHDMLITPERGLVAD